MMLTLLGAPSEGLLYPVAPLRVAKTCQTLLCVAAADVENHYVKICGIGAS